MFGVFRRRIGNSPVTPLATVSDLEGLCFLRQCKRRRSYCHHPRWTTPSQDSPSYLPWSFVGAPLSTITFVEDRCGMLDASIVACIVGSPCTFHASSILFPTIGRSRTVEKPSLSRPDRKSIETSFLPWIFESFSLVSHTIQFPFLAVFAGITVIPRMRARPHLPQSIASAPPTIPLRRAVLSGILRSVRRFLGDGSLHNRLDRIARAKSIERRAALERGEFCATRGGVRMEKDRK